jgi:acyl-CoA synthetase (AMP-forming)/AMP-acid ligase II
MSISIEGKTLVEVVQEQAALRGASVAIRYLTTGDVTGPTVELSFAELAGRASAVAAMLQSRITVGDRALLLYASGLEFVTAFFGCLFAGVIPVPVYPPDLTKPERSIAKLRAIVTDCGAGLALTTSEFLPMLKSVTPALPELAGLHCMASDACDVTLGAQWRRPDISSETVALVQYTSGSTGAPKGAVIRHRQVLANQRSIAAAMGRVEGIVGWLPVFHDMGLGHVFQFLYAGSSLVLMSPVSFLKRPARWLEAISHFHASTSGGPNFAYDLCVRRVTEEERAGLDLRSWRVAFCGAEPVREATYQRFAAAFESHGFARSAFYPCYGLAEATLLVTGATRGEPPKSRNFRASALERGEVIIAVAEDGSDCRSLVSSGKPSITEEVRIVDPDRRVPCDGVGEIWVRGPGVASGYWRGDEESRAVFGAHLADTGDGPFLRTGDLGFLLDGELFVAGRLKEMIILGGRNLFPPDIEATIEAAAPTLRKGCSAAFSIDLDGDEKLIIVAEHAAAPEAVSDLMRAIKRSVAEHHQAAAFDVILVDKGTIPKTSSGKLERYACRRAYLAGSLVGNRSMGSERGT